MWRCTRWSGTASRATTAGRTSTAGFSSCSRRRSGVAAEHASGARPWFPVVPRRRGSRPVAARGEPGVSPRATLALASSVTVPTGDAAAGRGAGRTQGSVLAVASVDAPRKLHVDVNLGPVELGADASPLRWFHSVGAAVALGRYGLTTELYGLTAGAGASAEWGALGAVTFRPAEWIGVDAGGGVGLWGGTPQLLFGRVPTHSGAV